MWTVLRGQAPKVVGPSCCICWMVSVLINTCVPTKVTGAQEVGNSTDSEGQWFCSSSSPSASSVVLWAVSDATCFGLMVWSSSSTVLLLHGHHERVRCIHTPDGPPETRAAHAILMLVAAFVTFMC